MPGTSPILDTLNKHEGTILPEWVNYQIAAATLRRDLINDDELREQSRRFIDAIRTGLQREGASDINTAAWEDARGVLEDLSRARARQGFSPSETATFVFSLKQPLFERLRKDLGKDAAALGDAIWDGTKILDALGLYTTISAMRVKRLRLSWSSVARSSPPPAVRRRVSPFCLPSRSTS